VSDAVIRRARADEARTLTEIAHAAKRRWGYPHVWMEAWSAALTISPRTIEEHTVYVAEVAGMARGVAVLADRGSHWSLDHLWVDPAVQRRGIGRALFAAIVREAGRRRAASLRIESDPHAVGFYARLGARPAGFVSAPVLGLARELPLLELEVPDGRFAVPDA
jgi:GNAT superfamily N-acetyltransferase